MRTLFIRLLSAQLAVVMIAMVAVGFSLSYLYTHYIFETKEQELVRIGNELAKELREPPDFFSLTRLGNLLNAANIFGDTAIWIADGEGRVILPTEVAGLRLGTEERNTIYTGRIASWRTYVEPLKETTFSVAVPVIARSGSTSDSSTISGIVILHSPMRGIMRTINDARRLIFLSGLLAICLAALLSFVFARRVATPLQEMRSVALDMARGHFNRRLEVKGDIEIAELAAALNEMAGRLGSTIHALGEEKAKTESVVAGLSEGVLAVDKEGRVHLVNEAARQLLAPLPLHIGELLADTSSDEHQNLLNAYVQVLANGEQRQITMVADKRTIQVEITPLIDPAAAELANNVVGAVALLRDVSETQKLEKMRRDFIADISHELRTPLTSIRGFAQAILENVVTGKEDIHRYLSVIMDESMRMIRLTNTLLDISRMESHHVKLQLTPVSLADIIADALSSLEPQIAEKQVVTQVNLPAELPSILADTDRLEQVFVNLLDNAVRYAPNSGVVTVTAQHLPTPEPGWVEITVTDNGPGIPPDELPFIWERFYKTDKARRSNRTGGTGLGLVIVKQLIELHKGTVEAGNALTGGAYFTVRLPAMA
jgi:two-component system sensor histidine kinase ResE